MLQGGDTDRRYVVGRRHRPTLCYREETLTDVMLQGGDTDRRYVAGRRH